MLAEFVGDINPQGAFMMIAFMAGITVMVTSLIVKRRSNKELDQEHELRMLDAHQKHERESLQIAAHRDTEMAKIEGGMITSHQREKDDY